MYFPTLGTYETTSRLILDQILLSGMSIELDWETLTSGPDGAVLAERIRSFIHDKFQTVALPRFIKSVKVHGFDFGTIAPRLDLKDITDPLPDFYDDDYDEDDEDDEGEGTDLAASATLAERRGERSRLEALRSEALRSEITSGGKGRGYDMSMPFLGTSTPGILGGPGLNYFQGHLGTGTHTPLAAVAGAHLGNSWISLPPPHDADLYTPSHSRNPSQSSISVENFRSLSPGKGLREKSSVSTLAPTSVNTSRPPTRDQHLHGSAIEEEDDGYAGMDGQAGEGEHDDDDEHAPRREPRVEDVQAVFRIQYAGDIRLNLTAEILLDYPMPSFVGIPLKLNITGLSFDGVGVLANIRKRVHFCFLSPEDALTAIGPDDEEEEKGHDDDGVDGGAKEDKGKGKEALPPKGRFGGLLQEIKVESEIGERVGGKQSLKNVGKVERFVLEQVRRIFEEEFVYPSFWTFLI